MTQVYTAMIRRESILQAHMQATRVKCLNLEDCRMFDSHRLLESYTAYPILENILFFELHSFEDLLARTIHLVA